MNDAFSDWKTTIPGLALLVFVGVALIMKIITFNDFQTFITGLVSGGLITINTKKQGGAV